MFKKRFKLDPAKATFFIGIALILAGASYYASSKIFFPPPITVQTVTGQRISIPAAWSMYTNSRLGFGIAHPTYYRAKETVYTLPATAQAGSDRSEFGVSFQTGSDEAPLGVNVTHQTLNQAIAYAKYNFAHYKTKNMKLTITRDMSLTVDGHPAVRIDGHLADTSNDGLLKNADSDFTDIYISANGFVYNIATELSVSKPFDDANTQTMFKSFVLAK